MRAYVIADIEINDPDGYLEYVALVQGTLDPFDGRFLVRGGATETLEGGWHPERTVVIEFPSPEHAHGWYTSADYERAKIIRQRTSTGSLILARGVES